MADRISFWRSPQKDEVDLVIETIPLLPIEVKYKNKVNSQDIAGLIKFLLKKNLTRGIIVTKDTLDEKEIKGVSVLFVPTWLFLLAIV
jgi:predicted AAA+ superfamily ATPase